MKTVAIIPALNEEKHIAEVVKVTKRYADKVWVVDGNSKDRTAELARGAGAKVTYSEKRGLGSGLRRGLNMAMRDKPDVLILLDGDGQHNPAEIPSLLAPIQNGLSDVVAGNRRVLRGMPPYRVLGNGILSAFANFHSKKQFADSMVGFWAIRREALPKLTEPGWGVYTELLLKCRSNGHRLSSVPIQPIYHADYRENSTLPPWKLGVKLLWFILKWRIRTEVLRRGSR